MLSAWKGMIRILSNYRPKLYYAKVIWDLPPTGRLKINTDGVSRGNLGEAHIATA